MVNVMRKINCCCLCFSGLRSFSFSASLSRPPPLLRSNSSKGSRTAQLGPTYRLVVVVVVVEVVTIVVVAAAAVEVVEVVAVVAA